MLARLYIARKAIGRGLSPLSRPDQPTKRRTSKARRSGRMAWRVLKVGTGFLLLVVGGVLAIPGVPGPGFLVLFAGLALLSAEFVWALRLRRSAERVANRVLPRRWRLGARS